jgi:hypothetical protein
MAENIYTQPTDPNTNPLELPNPDPLGQAEVVPMSTIDAVRDQATQLPPAAVGDAESTPTATSTAEAAPTHHREPAELARFTFRLPGKPIGNLADFAANSKRGAFERLKKARTEQDPNNPS